MKMITEITPYDFLSKESWDCDCLLDAIPPEKIDAFNKYIEERMPNGGTPTEINDLMCFDWEDILADLGL